MGNAQIQLGETSKKADIVCCIKRMGIVVDSYIAKDSKGYYILFPLGQQRNVSSKFRLGEDEQISKAAFKSLIEAFDKIDKGDSFDVKDFSGHPYVFSKSTKTMGKVIDMDIDVQNGFGAKMNHLDGDFYVTFYKNLYDKWMGGK